MNGAGKLSKRILAVAIISCALLNGLAIVEASGRRVELCSSGVKEDRLDLSDAKPASLIPDKVESHSRVRAYSQDVAPKKRKQHKTR